MSVMQAYVPVKLNGLLAAVAGRFPLPSEFAVRPTVDGWMRIAAGAPEGRDLTGYARQLTGPAVDNLLLASREEMEPRLRTRLNGILQARAGSRLVRLCWAVLQYNYTNQGVIDAAKAILAGAPELKSRRTQNLELFISGDGVGRLSSALLEKSGIVTDFLRAYELDEDSPLTRAVVGGFFCRCGAEGLVINVKRFGRMLIFSGDRLTEQMIANYLDKLEQNEFDTEINLRIASQWSGALTSALWNGIPQPLRVKFAEWDSRYSLRCHFVTNTKKLELYYNYISKMRQIAFICEGKMLIMDFGAFVVADQTESSQNSYYIERTTYGRLKAELEEVGEAALLNKYPDMARARDFMILEQEPEVMRFEFAEVGRFYVRDTLNILLGVTPDLRPSKTLIKKRPSKSNGKIVTNE